jgi:hypothetical protein
MKNFLQIVMFLTALFIGACVEVGTDEIPSTLLQTIEVKNVSINVIEGDTVYLNLHDSVVANRSYSLKVIPNSIGIWNPINDSVFAYICTPGYLGLDTAYYEVCPQNDSCIRGTILINIIKREIPCNPVAVDDYVNGRINIPVQIPVLQNDSLCGEPYYLSVSGFTGGGRLIQHDMGFTFIQDSSFVATSRPITFNYTVCDYDNKCASANVTIYPQNRRDYCAEKYQLNNDYFISDDSIPVSFPWEFLLRNDRFCPQDLISTEFYIAPQSVNRGFSISRIPGTNLIYFFENNIKRRPFVDSVQYTIPSASFGFNTPKRAYVVVRFD